MKKAPTNVQASGAGEQLSFLPPVPFCPTWPTLGTLPDRALGLFMDGRMLDHPEFERITQSWRLAAVVDRLIDLGWPVDSIKVFSPTDNNPNRIIARYYLDAKYTAYALALNGARA